MEKVALILLSTLILSGCSSYGMQGNPAAVQAGAAIGGVLGAIVGDRAGGYNASQFGALAGTVAGAAVGNAVTTPRQDDGAEEEYDNYHSFVRLRQETEEKVLSVCPRLASGMMSTITKIDFANTAAFQRYSLYSAHDVRSSGNLWGTYETAGENSRKKKRHRGSRRRGRSL